MNAVDVILLLAVVYVGLRGFRQGALSQMAAFGGAAAGLIGGAVAAPRLAGAVIDRPGTDLALLTLGLLLGIVLLGQGLGLAVGLRLRAGAERLGAGSADRTAGIAVGLVGLVVTVWLLASVLVHGPAPAIARALDQSRVVATIDRALPPPPDVFGRVSFYLNQHGFPQVFAGIGGATAPPVAPPAQGAVAVATDAGEQSTVQVESQGCVGFSSGSGFVTQPGFVVTNAHVIAGGQRLFIRDTQGTYEAVAIHVDPRLDLAVLSSPGLETTPIGWTTTSAPRGTEGATLGFPAGQRALSVRPATVRTRLNAVGRDIYGQGTVTREILVLSAAVEPGDSGGPFVTSDGLVGGVVFAAAASEPGTGYALTAEQVTADVTSAIARNTAVTTGSCRF